MYENFPPYKAKEVQYTRYRASDVFTRDPKKAKKLGYLEEIGIDLSNYSGQILPGDVLRAPKGFPLGGKKLEKSIPLKVIKNSREGVNRYKLSLEDKDGKKYTVRNFQMDGEYKGKKLPKWGLIRKGKNENISESKQVGTLYHYTSANGLKGILQSNSIKASEEYYLGNDLYFVSFTRNKNFHKKGSAFDVSMDYRIALDGNKLSTKYKITPFAYIPGSNYEDNFEYDWLDDEPENVVRDFFNATGDYDEQEESISFKKPDSSITNIKDYI